MPRLVELPPLIQWSLPLHKAATRLEFSIITFLFSDSSHLVHILTSMLPLYNLPGRDRGFCLCQTSLNNFLAIHTKSHRLAKIHFLKTILFVIRSHMLLLKSIIYHLTCNIIASYHGYHNKNQTSTRYPFIHPISYKQMSTKRPKFPNSYGLRLTATNPKKDPQFPAKGYLSVLSTSSSSFSLCSITVSSPLVLPLSPPWT